MADKVRIAVVGCGQRGPGHALMIQQSDTLELVAVCDIDEERACRLGEELKVDAVFDLQGILERDDIAAVSIASHTPHHAGIALDVARAGKHFLCEKPFADSIDSGREVVTAAEEAGVVAIVGFQNRFAPISLRLKELSQQIDIVQVTVTQHRGFFNPQYFYAEHYGGIMDGLSHDMDLALWWAGMTPKRVAGHQRRGAFKPLKNTIEFVNILAECENGDETRMVNMSGSMASIGMSNVYQLVGKRGCASSTNKNHIQYAFHEGFAEDKKPINSETHQEELDWQGRDFQLAMWNHFGQCVLEKKTDVAPAASLREGLVQVAVSQAGAESAETGRIVELDL